MSRTAADRLIRPTAKGLLCLLALVAALGGRARPARAQQVTVEVDQKALTLLFRRQIGKRWVLLRWKGAARLVLENPRLSITPLGIYVAGTLKSTSPRFSTEVEVRVRPRVKGATVRIDPRDVLVTRPSGVWGYLPRKILTRWLRSKAGASRLAQLGLDLAPLVGLLGNPAKYKIEVRLGFGRVTLTVSL